jgi:hypothetical protein
LSSLYLQYYLQITGNIISIIYQQSRVHPHTQTNQPLQQNTIMTSINLYNLRFVCDMSISAMTERGYRSVLKLFDHFLTRVLDEPELKAMDAEQLDADVEDILRGYSLWLHDTNIPKNYGNARDKDKGELPTTKSYMAATVG